MGPMRGINVVEVGVWVAGPSCAGILADWGADVVKIEPPEGDPFRGAMAIFGPDYATMNPLFDLDNRGKRSIALDLRDPRGRDLAFDVGAFWSRAGVASMLTPPGRDLPIQRGGMGDHTAGSQAAGAVAAALFHRERTGQGQRVAVSLARIGAYMLGWDLNTALRTGVTPVPATRETFPNPLILNYRCKDGRSVWLLGLQGDRHWPDVCRALGREDWLADERYATIATRFANCAALVHEI